MRSVLSSGLFLIVLILGSHRGAAQDNLKEELFGSANRKLGSAKENKAELYAPASFEKGMRYYNEAVDDFTNGRKLEDIREKVKNAEAYFAKALDECKLGAESFSTTMAARSDAASADASKSSPELWSKAEESFRKAALRLEEGNVADAKGESARATSMYRAAELEAIKSNFLSPARELVRKADETGVRDRAPKTLEVARKRIAAVEQLLNENRYDSDSARQLAQEAKYEASHAISLSQTIASLKRDDKTTEEVLLADESELQRVGDKLGLHLRFDNGFQSTINDLLTELTDRQKKSAAVEADHQRSVDSLARMTLTLREKDGQIDNLKLQIASMENRLGSLTQDELKLKQAGDDLQRKLDDQRREEEKVRGISSMFTVDEASVLRDADNIIIRLYGLTFPVGKNTIESEYYPLLTKVQDVIKKFPGCHVTIEGHTDSQGSDEANQLLSEGRAKAVAEYLMANMGVELPVQSQGFGESRPIASNDSPEGRAKNRRIDVVITPASRGQAR